MTAFTKVREAFLSEQDCSDPESCIRQFYLCRQLPQLKKVLRHADQQWMEEFLEKGGLEAIFDALSALANKHTRSMADALPQLECVECVKAVMNSPHGLEAMINSGSDRFVNKLVLELDSANVLMKLQLFLLLSALCKHSEEGLKATLQALDCYKQAKCQRHRYSLLVHELDISDDVPQYQAAVLAFVNYIMSSCANLDARLKLRSELNGLGFSEIIAVIRYSETECLSEQVRVYEQSQLRDQQEVEMPEGVDITNHEHLFRKVFEKVFNTLQSASFLHILQKMLLIERDTAKGDAIWSTLERVMDSALAMSGPQQAERIHTSAVERLRMALEEEELRKKEVHSAPTEETPPKPLEQHEDTEEVSLAPAAAAPPPPPPAPPLFNLGQRILSAVMSIFDECRHYQPKKPMKKLNWEKVPDAMAKAESSLWHGACREAVEVKVQVREETLEQLFSQRGKAATNCSAASKKTTHLPNSKKALNLNIVLDTLKCSNEEILEMIQRSDPSVLTLNQARVLVDMMPDENDTGFLEPFRGDPLSPLGRPERFLLALGQVEAFPLRLQVVKTKVLFKDLEMEYLPSMEVLTKSLDELVNCAALRELFYIILIIGNIINGGSTLGKAYGFKLTSLQRFSATLANVSRPNVNILHYLITVCEEDCPTLLSYVSTLPNLEAASRLSFNGIVEELDAYKEEIEEFESKASGQEGLVLPADLKEQIQDFMPEAQEKLDRLYTAVSRVRERGRKAAEYFCDDREDFLEKIFVEVKEFNDEFKKAMKETKKERPIDLVTQPIPAPEAEPTPSLGQTAVKRATSVITSVGLDYPHAQSEVFGPIVEEPPISSRSRSPSPTILNVSVIGTEGEPEPLEYTSLGSQPHSLGMAPRSLSPQQSPVLRTSHVTSPPIFKAPRMPPRGTIRRMMSHGYGRQLSLELYSGRFYEVDAKYSKQLSADPMGNAGDSLSHVADILHKMALEIQRDTKDDEST